MTSLRPFGLPGAFGVPELDLRLSADLFFVAEPRLEGDLLAFLGGELSGSSRLFLFFVGDLEAALLLLFLEDRPDSEVSFFSALGVDSSSATEECSEA